MNALDPLRPPLRRQAPRPLRPDGGGVTYALRSVALGVCLALLSGCASVRVPADGVGIFTGRVENYSGGEAALQSTATVFDGVFGSEIVIGEGSIAANGAFDFSFDPTLEPGALIDLFAPDELCTGVVVSASDVGGGALLSLDVVVANDTIGVIGLATTADDLDRILFGDAPSSATIVVRLYVERGVSVEGACTDGSGTYDLDLAAGWNLVQIDYLADGSTAFRNAGTSSGVAWYFLVLPRPGALSSPAAGSLTSVGKLRQIRQRGQP